MTKVTIGMGRASAADIFRKHGLTPFRNILSPEFFATHASTKFRTTTILVPEIVFWMMTCVALGDGAMIGAVTSFWAPLRALLPRLPLKPVTDAAFCTARSTLSMRFFQLLFLQVVSLYRKHFDQHYRWKSFRLLGIDGSLVTLPPAKALREAFGVPSNQNGAAKTPQALLVGLVGLWNGVCQSFLVVPPLQSEQWCAKFLIRFLCPMDLLLCDKAFASYLLMASVLHRRADFLFRVPCNRYTKARRLPTPSGRSDEWYVELSLPANVLKQCPHFSKTLRLRILQYQLPGYRPSFLITSLLDTHVYPYDELVALYHERWRHETCYREWKHTLQISNLRSHSKEGILKEIWVQLTLNNLVRWIMSDAAGPQLPPVKLKFLECKRLIVAAIAPMAVAPVVLLSFMYASLLKQIAKEKILIRPGRNYPRNHDRLPRNKGNGNYAKPARLTASETVP